MTERKITERKLKQATTMIYGTVLLAALQSAFLEIITTDYAHEIFSTYYFIEMSILGLMIVLGLKNRWTRIFLVMLTTYEAILFLMDSPISPDELLMIVIFGLRVYAITGLFSKTNNVYYKTVNQTDHH